MFRSLSLLGLCLALTLARADDVPAKIERPGLPNLYRVSDTLYRSAQPSAEGLRYAEKLGIKTVINLRAFHADTASVLTTKLKTEHIRFNTWHAEDEDVVRFLKIVSNTNAGPFLLHCQHGADRTGTMVAVYRMAIQGWSCDQAIKEMTTGGYGYHKIWTNLVTYLNGLDVPALRRKAGLSQK